MNPQTAIEESLAPLISNAPHLTRYLRHLVGNERLDHKTEIDGYEFESALRSVEDRIRAILKPSSPEDIIFSGRIAAAPKILRKIRERTQGGGSITFKVCFGIPVKWGSADGPVMDHITINRACFSLDALRIDGFRLGSGRLLGGHSVEAYSENITNTEDYLAFKGPAAFVPSILESYEWQKL